MPEVDFTPLEADVSAEQVEALRAQAREGIWGPAAALDARPSGGFNVGCGLVAFVVLLLLGVPGAIAVEPHLVVLLCWAAVSLVVAAVGVGLMARLTGPRAWVERVRLIGFARANGFVAYPWGADDLIPDQLLSAPSRFVPEPVQPESRWLVTGAVDGLGFRIGMLWQRHDDVEPGRCFVALVGPDGRTLRTVRLPVRAHRRADWEERIRALHELLRAAAG